MHKPLISFLSLLVLFCWTSVVSAEEPGVGEEPKITITHEDDKTYYEYRVNGVLKEIKVVPKVGPAYYLVPSDGGGWIQEESSETLVPQWVIFSW